LADLLSQIDVASIAMSVVIAIDLLAKALGVECVRGTGATGKD